MLNWQLSALEKESWTHVSGLDINPIPAQPFVINKLKSSLQLICIGPAFAGALAKNVSPLPSPSTEINFSYSVLINEDIEYGQVIETDMKLTDKDGWTYDGSFQINVTDGWMTQINNPWVDTGVRHPLSIDTYNLVGINYKLDYVNHNIRINDSASIPALRKDWQTNTIITQLQLCTSKPGAYSLKFKDIGYKG